MKQVFFHISAVLSLCLFSVDNVVAQTSHAHSSATQWHGIDVLKIYQEYLQDPTSHPDLTWDRSTHSGGMNVYLYNVGTGKFAIDGGDYGMESRLFYEDFGRQMKLIVDDGVLKINPSITEMGSTTDKYLLTCNVPTVTRTEGWEYSNDVFCPTSILDGYYYWGKWTFERIPSEDNNSEFHTYYMSQKHDSGTAYKSLKSKNYQGTSLTNITIRFGAAYGEYCSDGTTSFINKKGETTGTNYKGNGYYVHIDDDRSCWTTAGNPNNSEASPWGNQTLVEMDNGDKVSIDELYQWRIISEEEYEQVLTREVIGLNPSVSSLIHDRDFTRNSDDFFTYWYTTPKPGYTYPSEPRYGYTWGNVDKGKLQSYKNTDYDSSDPKNYYPYRWRDNESWQAPLKLKKVFDSIKQSKYGFMSFEGVGAVSVDFEVPQPGWYQVEANVISFSSDATHKAYMYAKAHWVTVTDQLRENPGSAYEGFGQVELAREDGVDNVKSKYPTAFEGVQSNLKGNENVNVAVGTVLTKYGQDYRHKFWVYLDPTYYNQGGDNKKMTFGIIKENATRSSVDPNNRRLDGVDYFYDRDWVCIDDIKISYMGLAPAFFYEEEENLDYLVYDANYINERPSAQINGQYSGALSLERTFKKNQWNSFSFPIPLTGEQIRQAFGEDAELLELHSIGGLSHEQAQANSKYMIDFQTVELKQAVTDPTNVPVVVEPGKFYLLKPTADPVGGVDPKGRVASYYELGRNFFSVDATQVPSGYAHTIMDVTTPYSNSAIQSWNCSEVVTGGDNDGVAYVCYIQTPGYAEWTTSWLDSNNKYNHTQDGSYQGTDIYNRSVNLSGNVYSQMYAPKGAYVMSDGKMYELNKDTRLKGFRGWITLTHSLFSDDSSSAQIGISIDGVVDGDYNVTGVEAQTIVPLPVPDNTTVYDLCGRKVGTVGMTLPHGIYIVAGKKMYVK